MIEASEADIRTDLERARAELRKLGVELAPPFDDRVYQSMLDLPPRLGRPCSAADIGTHVNADRSTVNEALRRLKRAGRALNPLHGCWVAITD